MTRSHLVNESYEKQAKERGLEHSDLSNRIEFGVMKYLWMANPLSKLRKDSIPRFLRNIELLKNFSDNELRILYKYMHNRKFSDGEIIFREGDIGIGFYFIFSGQIEITREDFDRERYSSEHFLLEEFGYFGEMALLQDGTARSATATAKRAAELIGIFKPDLELMIERHPVIAAKLIQSISLSLADRLYYISEEANKLTRRVHKLQNDINELNTKKEDSVC